MDPDRSAETYEQQRSVVALLPVCFDKIEHRLADLAERPSGKIGQRPLDRLVTQLHVGCVGCLVEPVRVNGEQVTGLGAKVSVLYVRPSNRPSGKFRWPSRRNSEAEAR